MKVLLFIFFILLQIVFNLALTNSCYLWDSQCTTAFAQKAAPLLVQRMSESGVEIEPLNIDTIEIKEHGVEINKKNVKVYGFNNMVVDHLSFDIKTNISCIIFHTNLYVTGHYNTSGNIFSNPVFEEGDFRLLMENVEIEIIFPYNIKKNSNNEDVAEIKDYLLRYDVKSDAKLEFDNLYDVNMESIALHLFLNKYWKMIIEVFDPDTFDAIGGRLVEVFRDYLITVPISTLVKL